MLYDPRSGGWSDRIAAAFGLPGRILPPLVDPGTVVGELTESVRARTGLGPAGVIAPCTHDTGSAVAAIPGEGADWAFISSGTWSVVGTLTENVVTGPDAFAAGLCNELTAGGLFLCRNTMGLWLLQQARAAWRREGKEYPYAELAALAAAAGPGGPLVNADDPRFLAPADMPAALAEYCRQTGQTPPVGVAEVVRCILESLALSYRRTLDGIGSILGRRFRVIHVIGGGSRNSLLCRMTAGATGLPVVAGPAEATAMGNILVQALARGEVGSVQDIRDVVRRSTELARYEPGDQTYWADRSAAYRLLCERSAG